MGVIAKTLSGRTATTVAAWLLLAGVAAWGQDATSAKTDAGSTRMMKSPDALFALKAAQGGTAEVRLGELASQKGTNPDVRAFGQMMVDDHTKANENLKSIVGRQSMTLPESLNAKDQALYAKLRNESGAKFDHDYVRAMVKDHQQDVKEFTKESGRGSDSQIKNFAAETLPVLQKHLEKIQSIQSSIGK